MPLTRFLLCIVLAAPPLHAQIDSFDDLAWAVTDHVTVESGLLLLQTGYLVSYAEQATAVFPESGRLSLDVELDTNPGPAPDSYCAECATQVTVGCVAPQVVASEELDQGGSSGPFPKTFSGVWSFQIEAGECLTLATTMGGWSLDCFSTARFTNLLFQPALHASVDSLSLSVGGTQAFELFAPLELADSTYLLLGSRSGTSPGLPLGEFLIPLNPDGYFVKTAVAPNMPPLSGSLGVLDAAASGSALLTAPPGVAPQLVGETLSHAYVVLDTSARIEYVSPPVELQLLP